MEEGNDNALPILLLRHNPVPIASRKSVDTSFFSRFHLPSRLNNEYQSQDDSKGFPSAFPEADDQGNAGYPEGTD